MRCKVRMNKNSAIIASFVLILLILSTSGCMDYFNISDGSVIYESHPTKIQYNIRYGYWINFSGTGKYLIDYDCDEPEILIGETPSELLYSNDYKHKTLANNIVVNWNISGTDNNNYKLGIAANVTAENFLIPDLGGDGALSLQEIKTNYPIIFNQYCHEQSVKNKVYIDPNNVDIKLAAQDILGQTDNNNSFILAKELFIWLKQNTDYQIHITNNEVQPASETLQLGTGDCDDLSFLYISLCRSLGIPARFIRGYLVEETDGTVSAVAHAWTEVFVGGNIGNQGWIPVECACPSKDMTVQINQNFGVESVGHLRLFKDDGSNESMDASISGPMARYDTGMEVEMTAFVEIYNYIVLESKELTVDKNGNRAYK
jgi:hypothetical protein